MSLVFIPILYPVKLFVRQKCAKMFTEPKIVSSPDLTKRSYITFYFNNTRIREYNGNNINQRINPNCSDTLKERNELLVKLKQEYSKALLLGQYPASNDTLLVDEPKAVPVPSTKSMLQFALDKKLGTSLSRTYKRNLRLLHEHINVKTRYK
jgi:hypothetical protein